jgi:hypothetical protein
MKWALVKSVILILGGERREENLEKGTVASLHEYELGIGDMGKITEKSKHCFSHGFTVLEETESKLPLLVVPAIAMAPLSETADLYSPLPEGKEWEEHPEMGNIEEEMHYLHIRPNKGLGRKNDPSFVARISMPPQPHEF